MKRLIAATALACTMAVPAAAFDMTAMTAPEREAFRAEIRDYLLENPEVLMEAIGVLEARQADAKSGADAEMIAANAEAIFNDGHSWVGGNPDGDITLVEFADYRCGYCRRAHEDVKALLESDGNIRLIYKEFPILGDASLASARFALATRLVAGDDAYAQMQDALITLQTEPSEPVLLRLAEQLDLDGEAILAEMDNPEVDRVIAANHELARKLQINGTPTFILEDEMLRGYLPLDAMRELVEEVRG